MGFYPKVISVQAAESVAYGVRNDFPQPYSTQRDWGRLPAGTQAWAAVTADESSTDGDFI